MVDFPKAHVGIHAIKPYVGGDVTPAGMARRIVLASNENPFGTSPYVKEAIKSFQNIHSYPNGLAVKLRHAIGDTYTIDSQWILCGNGSEEILHLCARAFVNCDDEVIIPKHGFGVYQIATLAMGGKPVIVPRDKDFSLNPLLIQQAVTNKTKIIYLDHPGNPVASYINAQAFEVLLKNIPSNILVVIDAAYAEYLKNSTDYHPGFHWVEKYPNVVMTRTFSKIYGMAGLRLGWLYANPEILDQLNRIRAPFNTSSLTQSAGIAALQDPTWVDTCAQENKEQYEIFCEFLQDMNLPYMPFFSNFVMVKFKDSNSVYRHLGEKGIIVRPMRVYDLPDYLRITIGKNQEMEELMELLTECPYL